MKKLLSLLLATLLLISLSTNVLAVKLDTLGEEGSTEIDVTAKYQASSNTPTVYSVDIKWESMTFTYTETGTKNWNPSNHSYSTDNVQGAWDKTSATITITNHSNAAVDVTLTPTITQGLGITGILMDPTATLDAGVEGNYAGADSHTSTLIITGTPNNAITADGVKVGTIKVTIQ